MDTVTIQVTLDNDASVHFMELPEDMEIMPFLDAIEKQFEADIVDFFWNGETMEGGCEFADGNGATMKMLKPANVTIQ